MTSVLLRSDIDIDRETASLPELLFFHHLHKLGECFFHNRKSFCGQTKKVSGDGSE